MFNLQSFLEVVVVFVLSVLIFYYLYYQYCFTYWKKKGVATLNPSFPLGDLSLRCTLGLESIFVHMQNIYEEFTNKHEKVGGIYSFSGPVLFPVDTEIIKRILITDFDHFVDRGTYISEDLPLSLHLFSLHGEQWKKIRAKFSPGFTSGKIKSMFNILLKHYENLVQTLALKTEEDVDVKALLMRITVDITGSAAFGIDCNSLQNPETEFARMVNSIFTQPQWNLVKLVLFEEGLRNPGNIFKIIHDNRLVETYFTDLVKKTIEYRDANKVERDDFLNILMKMRESGVGLTEIVAQSFLFFTAGYETTSSTISNCIHELCYNEEVQDELREEIHENLGRDSSKFLYEKVMTLPVLDKVVKETLRKFPPVPLLNRMCVKPYKIPGTDSVIDVGTPVVISVLGLHRNAKNFPDPLEFKPERFDAENKVQPFTYLPFGDGPRNCIGMRFGLMQTKLGLAFLLNDFKFLPSAKTPRNLPINPSTTSLVFTVLGGVYTKVVKV